MTTLAEQRTQVGLHATTKSLREIMLDFNFFIPSLKARSTLQAVLAITTTITSMSTVAAQPAAGQLEIVAELKFRPANVAATDDGKVFATVHPLDKPSGAQLITIKGKHTYRPWPNAKYQNNGKHFPDDRLDSPLGIYRDKNARIWVADMGFNIGKTRIWAFDSKTGKLFKRIDLAASVAPKGSFVQDLVVDDVNGWIFLADLANPGLIAVNIGNGKARRFGNHPSLNAEANVKMVIAGKPINFNGKPAEVAIDPITISDDKETIFYGATNGRSWYSVPAKLFRNGATDQEIANAIVRVGDKPISDGATTDADGNHYITNVTESGIDILTKDGKLTPFIRDARLDWPDGIQFGSKDLLYISVNQLHKTPAFTGGADEGTPPYYIMRVQTKVIP